jgi:hypothetical protein
MELLQTLHLFAPHKVLVLHLKFVHVKLDTLENIVNLQFAKERTHLILQFAQDMEIVLLLTLVNVLIDILGQIAQ